MKEVLLPSLGADMSEGTIVKWLKAEGDMVNKGDKIAEIETDKTVVEMDAYYTGILRKIISPEGTLAPVGTVIALVGEKDEPIPDLSATPTPATASAAEPEAQPDSAPAEAAAPPEPPSDAPVKASPMARRLAHESGINLAHVRGSGPNGRITKEDVLNYKPGAATEKPAAAEAQPQPTPEPKARPELKPTTASVKPAAPVQPSPAIQPGKTTVSSMRQQIAQVTLHSKTTIPHFYITYSVDMTEAMSLRQQVNSVVKDSDPQARVSVNDIALKATALALKEHPGWNSSYEKGVMTIHPDLNIGIAIALERGLIVPALLKVQDMSLFDIARASKSLGERTRGSGLTQQELTQATFSTTNLGMMGAEAFAPIIVPGQAAMLGIGAVMPNPVVIDGQVVVRQIMKMIIAADHRVGDGAEAAVFMNTLKAYLEQPAKLLIL